MSASTPKTLWIWSTLPRQGIRAEDQQWRRDGDCVENAGRIQMGEFFDVIDVGVRSVFRLVMRAQGKFLRSVYACKLASS